MLTIRFPRLPGRRAAVLPLVLVFVLTVTACSPATAPEAAPEATPGGGTAPADTALLDPTPDTPLTLEDTTYPPLDWQLDWAADAVFYEIFVRSFADSDGDGIGDFPGLTAHLDHLNDGDPATTDDLGVTGIWLMPVFASPSYHGYDVTDYRRIHPDYGTVDDFRRFLAAAHERGIRVIVDLMINHTSSQHPWFENARRGPDAPLRDWYVWRTDDPGWTQPWGTYPTWHENDQDGWYYYGIFWGGMPDLDFRNPEVREEVKAIADFWLDLGVDGFRLDAARHIIADGPGEQQNGTPETHAWWRDFGLHVHARHPGALLVGEVWSDAERIAPYFDEMPMNFDFPLGEAMVAAAKTGRAAPVLEALETRAAAYPDFALPATFLTNHDMERIGSQLAGSGSGAGAEDRVEAARRGRLGVAAAMLLTLPGTPFLYYGEELGMRNGPGGADEWKRTPMPWSDEGDGGGFTTGRPWHPFAPGRDVANVAAQDGVEGSLLERYRALVHLRRGSAALASGGIEVVETGAPAVLAFLRTAGEERVLVVHNLGGEEAEATLGGVGGEGASAVWADDGVTLEGGADGWQVGLPAWASGVWRLE